MPSLPPGGPGRGALFSTTYFPFGDTAGIAQLRTALPTLARSNAAAFPIRANADVLTSPPMIIGARVPGTVWHVLQPLTPAARRKSSGASAPGWMRRTRPFELDQ